MTLKLDPEHAGRYLWPSGLVAIGPWGDKWLAYRDCVAKRVLRTEPYGDVRLFLDPASAADALGAKLPESST